MSSSSSNNESAFVPIDFSRHIVDVDASTGDLFEVDFVWTDTSELDRFAPSLRQLEVPPGKAFNHIHFSFTWDDMKFLEETVQAMQETPILTLTIEGPVPPDDGSVSQQTIKDLCLRLASIPKVCFCLGSSWSNQYSPYEWVCFPSIFAGLQRCCCRHDVDFKMYCPEDGDTDALRRLLLFFDSRAYCACYYGTLKLDFDPITERSLQNISRVLQQDKVFKLDVVQGIDATNDFVQPSQETLAVLEAAISQNLRLREFDFGLDVDPTIIWAICRGLQKNKGIQFLYLCLRGKEQLDSFFESLPLFNLKHVSLMVDDYYYDDDDDDVAWHKVFTVKMKEGMLQNSSLLSLSYLCYDSEKKSWCECMEDNFASFLTRNKLLSKIPPASSRLEPGVLAEYVAKIARNPPESSASPLFRTLQTFFVPYLTNQFHDEAVKSPRNKRQRVE